MMPPSLIYDPPYATPSIDELAWAVAKYGDALCAMEGEPNALVLTRADGTRIRIRLVPSKLSAATRYGERVDCVTYVALEADAIEDAAGVLAEIDRQDAILSPRGRWNADALRLRPSRVTLCRLAPVETAPSARGEAA